MTDKDQKGLNWRHENRFSAGQALDITGVSYLKLVHWAKSGFLSPSIRAEKGHERVYSVGDVAAMFMANLGRGVGISLKAMAGFARHLQRDYSSLDEINLRTEGKYKDTVVFVDEDGRYYLYEDEKLAESIHKWGKSVMGVFALGDIEEDLHLTLFSYDRLGGRRRRRGRPKGSASSKKSKEMRAAHPDDSAPEGPKRRVPVGSADLENSTPKRRSRKRPRGPSAE